MISISICIWYSCEGKCLRSFHANIGSGAEDFCCETLGYTDAQVKVLTSFLSLCVYSLYLLVLIWTLVIFSFNQYLVLCRQCQYFCVEIASISNINALFVADWDFLINLLMQSQQRYTILIIVITSQFDIYVYIYSRSSFKKDHLNC